MDRYISSDRNKKEQIASSNNLFSMVVPKIILSNQVLEDLKVLGDFI